MTRSAERHDTGSKTLQPEPKNFYLTIATPGLIDSLKIQPVPRQPPAAAEVEIEVVAAGLNFKEVLLALGLIPVASDYSYRFGLECAGRITAVGAGVKGFAIGDEVIAFGTACFGRFITTAARLVAPKPAHLSLEAAATIPIAFATAYYSLITVGKLCPGEKILIHSAAGGVGMAAVEIAQSIGAEVFATASTPEKREVLRSRGIQSVMDSRSLTFVEEVLRETDGKGVDVVLNSLGGEFMTKSLSVLGRYGRFLEIGQRDILNNSSLGLRAFEQRLSFFAIQVEPDAPHFDAMWQAVVQQFQEQRFHPLPYQVFPLTAVADAFVYMTEAKHIGKVVISLEHSLTDSDLPQLRAGTGDWSPAAAAAHRSQAAPQASRDVERRIPSTPIHSAVSQPAPLPLGLSEDFLKQGILPSEGIQIFRRALGSRLPQVLVSTRDLLQRMGDYSTDQDWNQYGTDRNTASRYSLNQENSRNATVQTHPAEPSNRSQSAHPRPALPHEYVPPRNQIEQTIATLWQTFLGIDPIGIHDSFFELGGHSLLATQVIAKMGQAIQMNLSLDMLFDHPTIAQVAQHVEQMQNTAQTLQAPLSLNSDDRTEIEL